MKKYLLLFLSGILLYACKDNKHQGRYEIMLKVYENAIRHGDVNVAVNACFEIIATDSTRNNFYDTLVYLYLNTQNQGSTYLAARSSLKFRPDNEKMNRVGAEYAKYLGLPDTAIYFYRKTFTLNNKLENLYDVAQIQYNMGNLAGAEETADIIIKHPEGTKEKITLSLDKDHTQQVPVKAAALNIKGTIFIEMGNKEIALKYLNEALDVFPDFKIAKNNKEEILSGKIQFKK